jgi:hypothetical protein
LLAERASQKPPKGAQEHAARNDPTIRRVLRPHMAYERGAFKVNCCIALNGLLQVAAPKYLCRKFSQSVIFAQKTNSLPLRHTFLSPNY